MLLLLEKYKIVLTKVGCEYDDDNKINSVSNKLYYYLYDHGLTGRISHLIINPHRFAPRSARR